VPLQNQFDTIDLSDNAIVRLEGFPRLLRLKEVFLNNNRIGRIEKTVSGEPTAVLPMIRAWINYFFSLDLCRADPQRGDAHTYQQPDQQPAGEVLKSCKLLVCAMQQQNKKHVIDTQDLDPLAGFKKLTLLSLIGNPVVTKPNYR
jgi:Leucine-rich repeat (LRR) protein